MPLIVVTFLILLLGADLSLASNATVDVSATVSRVYRCKFNTGDSILNIGLLDPDIQVDRTIKTSLTYKCSGSDAPAVFVINSELGSFEAGSEIEGSMSHSSMSDANIPYRLSINMEHGAEAKDDGQNITISVKVKGSDYSEVYSGSYSDVVYISINQ